MKAVLSVLIALAFISAPVMAAETAASKTVTLDATDKPIAEVIDIIAKATGEKILVEKLVSGSITAKIADATVEKALDAVTKSLHIQWRKIYVIPGTILEKDADALAAQMRTVLSLKFPDILIAPVGTGRSFVHIQKEAAADEITKAIPAEAGFTAVYLVTDDTQAYKKELKDESKKKIATYSDIQRKLMKDFLDMSPEERKAALVESMNLMNQLGSEGMKQYLEAVLELDPAYVSDMNKMSMQVIMNLDPQTRKSMLRMSVQSSADVMEGLTPEQQMQLEQEIMEIMQETHKFPGVE